MSLRPIGATKAEKAPKDDGQAARFVAAQQPIPVMLSATSEISSKKTTLGALSALPLDQGMSDNLYYQP
jgi:hypothetical protein